MTNTCDRILKLTVGIVDHLKDFEVLNLNLGTWGLNHLQNMPETPGSGKPLAIMNVGGAGKGRAKAKPKAKGATRKEEPSTPQPAKKRKGDDELHQIHLKRQAIVMKNNFVAWHYLVWLVRFLILDMILFSDAPNWLFPKLSRRREPSNFSLRSIKSRACRPTSSSRLLQHQLVLSCLIIGLWWRLDGINFKPLFYRTYLHQASLPTPRRWSLMSTAMGLVWVLLC